jgi:hypothetical protein
MVLYLLSAVFCLNTTQIIHNTSKKRFHDPRGYAICVFFVIFMA